jgi:hypothetical protein
MSQEDLWGDLPVVESLRTPLVILKEQSELLQEKTEGLLVGQIKPRESGLQFRYEFAIVAPTLNNYLYETLVIVHGIGFYPVNIFDPNGHSATKSCATEEEYKQGLRDIFASEHVKTVISKLLTHIRSQA